MVLAIGLVWAAPLSFSPPDSSLRFSVDSSLDVVSGVAGVFSGTLDPIAGTGEIEIAAGSLRTGLGPRDSRLQSYALEAVRFPVIEARLIATDGVGTQDDGDTTFHTRLTIREVTRPVDVRAHYSWEGPNLRLTGSVVLEWALFGVPDPSVLVATVSPTVTVSFDLVARPSELPADPKSLRGNPAPPR